MEASEKTENERDHQIIWPLSENTEERKEQQFRKFEDLN